MEEKFLKARQEREDTRTAVKARDPSDLAQQREQLEQQIQELERNVEVTVAAGKSEEAQQALNTLRTLIQDTSSCALLTAYGMAKVNKSLSRLQQLVDEQTVSQGGPRKFKFSARAKAKAEEVKQSGEAPPPAAPSQPPAEELPGAPQGSKTYGGVANQTLCLPAAKAVFVRDCAACTILCVPTAGSAFFTNCTDCTVYVCCHQLRLKDCHNVQVYVWCTSTPIIEKCDGMGFGPYSCWRGLLASTVDGVHAASHDEWARSVGDVLDVENVKLAYTNVDDFQWIKKTQSPHWHVIEEKDWAYVDDPFSVAAVHQRVNY